MLNYGLLTSSAKSFLMRPFANTFTARTSCLWRGRSLTTSSSFLQRVSRGGTTQYSNKRSFYRFSAANDFVEKHENLLITYLTDVEGDKAYLDRYVTSSKVLCFRDTPSSSTLPYPQQIDFSEPNAMLVYGGDIWDKGGFDLYVIRQLVDLKQRHPNRVILILGNRDINKLRIMQEIGLPDRDLPPHPGILWFKGTGRVGDPDGNLPPTDAAERLRWMLGKTMGSPDAFEHRRNELKWERNVDTVEDEDVVRSYQESCHPNGELGQLLSNAQLAMKIGPLFFIHGGLPLTKQVEYPEEGRDATIWDDLTFCMPWLPDGETCSDYGVHTIEDWIDALNEFCQARVEDWKDEIQRIEVGDSMVDDTIWAFRGGYHFGPPYCGLIQYGMGMTPEGKLNPTVVYNSFTPSGMPERFYPDNTEEPNYLIATRQFFEKANIQLILTGHKPQGDMPSPIRVDHSSWVICADTSYSAETHWHQRKTQNGSDEVTRRGLGRGDSVSFRGEVAVSEVLLQFNGTDLQSVKYHGVLSDGTAYETVNLLDHTHNSTIGQIAPADEVPSALDSPHEGGRWWTKSIFNDGSRLFHAGEGYDVWNWMSRPATKKQK